MKKSCLIIFLLILISGFSFGQTKLYIIGTVHKPSEKINSETFFNILTDINPDVILCEKDSVYFTEDFLFDSINVKPSNGNERNAVYKYEQENEVMLRPYDIEHRYDFFTDHNYFENETNMINDIFSLAQTNTFSPESAEDYDLLWYVLGLYNLKNYTLAEQNSESFQDFTELKHSIIHDVFLRIIDKNESLSQWKEFATLHKNFWFDRNEAMVKNILKYTKEFEGKTIVVLTGSEHLYYLMNFFNEEENKNNLILMDYWKSE